MFFEMYSLHVSHIIIICLHNWLLSDDINKNCSLLYAVQNAEILGVHNNRNFQTWLSIKIQLTIFIAVGSFKQRKSCFEEKWHRVKIKFSTLQSFWGAGFSQFYFSSSHQTRLASTTKYFLLFLCQVHAWEMAYLASSSSFLSCVNEMCDEFRQL